MLDRFAALIQAGISPSKALELAELKNPTYLEEIRFGIRLGAPVTRLVRVLQLHADALASSALEVSKAQSVPSATRKLMLWLPGFGLVLGQTLGLDPISALSTNVGLALFLFGLLLVYVGNEISSRLIIRATSNQEFPAQSLLRFSMLIASGHSLSDAKEQAGLSDQDFLSLCLKTGANLDVVLAHEIQSSVAAFASEQIQKASRLSVTLLVPLGLTTLPAFLIFTVVPMVIGLTHK